MNSSNIPFNFPLYPCVFFLFLMSNHKQKNTQSHLMQNSYMEAWFMIIPILCLSLSLILKAIFFPHSPLPPGPPKVPIISTFKLLQQYITDPKSLLQNLHAKYGPIFTLQMGSHTDIFIANRFLAHQALIQNSATFADRPKANPTKRVISSNQNDILFSFYGPIWRLLRRNLTSRILHPSQVIRF